jgi:probable F420-dependent oxidoreductase
MAQMTTPSLPVGVFLPYTEIGPDPGFLREFAQTAESLGYTQLHIPDHIVNGLGPSGSQSTTYDPLVLFAHLAASTTTIELVTSILTLPLRQTLLVAKQAAEVDILSGQRLRLGVGTGAGGQGLDYEALGMDYASRGRRQEEQVRFIRLLWDQERVDFDGEFHRIRGAGIDPRPGRRIPIWFGGGDGRNAQTGEPVLRRMATVGDGWMPLFRPDDEASLAARDRLFGYLRDAGRDPAEFQIEGFTHMRHPDPDRWRERLAAWQAFGATHVSLRPMGLGCTAPQQFLDAIRRYREGISG